MSCEARYPLPTIERLYELFAIDAGSGELRRVVARGNRAAGSNAGRMCMDGYLAVRVDHRSIQAHRVVWAMATGAWPSGNIDHINGVKTDNRLSNLRDVDQTTNMQNLRVARSDSQSKLIGAFKRPGSSTWRSAIKVGGKLMRLGSFKTEEAAHAAYVEAKRKLHEGCTI